MSSTIVVTDVSWILKMLVNFHLDQKTGRTLAALFCCLASSVFWLRNPPLRKPIKRRPEQAAIQPTVTQQTHAADSKQRRRREFWKLKFKPLFNGKDLTGWRNPYDYGNASVKDEEIHLLANNKFFLVTEKKYSDFRLSVDVHLPRGRLTRG